MSKYDQLGHAGASLVAMPRRQYESFFVVVKLSVVVRRASRRLKALIKVHLINGLHFKMEVTSQVKVRSKVTVKRFHLLDSLVA